MNLWIIDCCLPKGDLKITHPFKGGIERKGHVVPKGRLKELKEPGYGIQPSLRDSRVRDHGPGSELPGYFQISLREIRNTGQACAIGGSRMEVGPSARNRQSPIANRKFR